MGSGEKDRYGAITNMKHLPVRTIESDDRMDREQAVRFLKSAGLTIININTNTLFCQYIITMKRNRSKKDISPSWRSVRNNTERLAATGVYLFTWIFLNTDE